MPTPAERPRRRVWWLRVAAGHLGLVLLHLGAMLVLALPAIALIESQLSVLLSDWMAGWQRAFGAAEIAAGADGAAGLGLRLDPRSIMLLMLLAVLPLPLVAAAHVRVADAWPGERPHPVLRRRHLRLGWRLVARLPLALVLTLGPGLILGLGIALPLVTVGQTLGWLGGDPIGLADRLGLPLVAAAWAALSVTLVRWQLVRRAGPARQSARGGPAGLVTAPRPGVREHLGLAALALVLLAVALVAALAAAAALARAAAAAGLGLMAGLLSPLSVIAVLEGLSLALIVQGLGPVLGRDRRGHLPLAALHQP